MEHRWGRRIPLDTNITLNCRSAGRSRARLRDISSGGAFVQTPLPLPVHARVELVLANSGIEGTTRLHRFEAIVSRIADTGVGLMFVQFNPEELTHLLARLAAGTAPALRALPAPGARRRHRSETK